MTKVRPDERITEERKCVQRGLDGSWEHHYRLSPYHPEAHHPSPVDTDAVDENPRTADRVDRRPDEVRLPN